MENEHPMVTWANDFVKDKTPEEIMTALDLDGFGYQISQEIFIPAYYEQIETGTIRYTDKVYNFVTNDFVIASNRYAGQSCEISIVIRKLPKYVNESFVTVIENTSKNYRYVELIGKKLIVKDSLHREYEGLRTLYKLLDTETNTEYAVSEEELKKFI